MIYSFANLSNSSSGSGFAYKNPCAIWQPHLTMNSLCSSVSIPSVTTSSFKSLHIFITFLKTFFPLSSSPESSRNSLSIFIISTGKSFKRLSAENPEPKSSIETINSLSLSILTFLMSSSLSLTNTLSVISISSSL